ncbi:MAG TPA: fibronectin type III domain-containing protein [Candidatus Deferrimicrobium sp.]|nr:fibronectin type III domain-containing protein [Candidatus Deferrimicrobium sp.]
MLVVGSLGQVNAQSDSTILFDSAMNALAPVTSLLAADHKYDNGERIDLSWIPSIDDQPVNGKITGYGVYRLTNAGNPALIADLPSGSSTFSDDNVEPGSDYSYYIVARSAYESAVSVRTAPLSPQREWLNLNRGFLFLIAALISAAVIYFVQSAKRGKKLFVRKISGLEAIDDAVGRATEMGRPVLFIPGIHDMDDVQTLAALTILGRVSRTIADYDTKIFMPVARSLVMTAARETIKASYQAAGRPDAYSDDMVSYVTDEQFGYVAAVDGLMVREKPATVFLLGSFFAESLILAETGNSVGAIQIAGTARPAQLPFFIAACDFTLIGEELFAASAYLAGEPRQLGSLKGQDVGKAVAMVVIVVGALAATLGEAWDISFMQNIYHWLSSVFSSN